VKVIVLILLVTTMMSVRNLNMKVKEISKITNSQIEEINSRYNNVLNNELLLLRYIKDNTIVTEKLQQILKNKEVNIDNIINSDVFVKGIFGLGAGTVIKNSDNEMYILTCHHVVEDVIMANEMGFPITATIGYSKTDEANKIAGMTVYSAEVVKYDVNVDLALLKVKTTDNTLVAAKIAIQDPEKGDTIYSVGSPLGLLRTVSTGILANKIDGFFISENVTTFGNSGGGLYNLHGELIGVPAQVPGYSAGLDKDGNETFVPESSLGMSRDLVTIRNFLEGVI
jgi:S1-C subfamily serine protease